MSSKVGALFEKKKVIMPKVVRDFDRTLQKHATNSVQFKRKVTYDLSKIINNRPFIDHVIIMKRQGIPVKSIVEDFLQCTSVHGLQYFGKLPIKVSSYGKIGWACIVIASFICSSLMVIQFWMRYQHNPTNTYVQSFTAPIYLVPFPAITICSYTLTPLHRQEKALKLLELPSNFTREDAIFILQHGSNLAQPDMSRGDKHLNKFKELLTFNNMQLIDFLKMLRPCEDVVHSCFWQGKKINCANNIRMSHSTRGMCCSFNYILEDYINLSGDTQEPTLTYSDFYGPTSGLAVVLNEDLLRGHKMKIATNSEGVMVSVHHSLDYPGNEIITRILQKGQELQISMSAILSIKVSGIYHQDERGNLKAECIPKDEEWLKYLPKYRYTNCYVNCRMEAMLQICGCLPYEYDPVIKKHAINACTLDDNACLAENYHNMHIVTDVYKSNFTCSCQSPCKDISYSVIPIKTTIAGAKFANSPIYQNISQGQAVLRAYMSSQTFTVYETLSSADELYFLASVGGIFSLFLGCSFLSVVELIYFGFLICRAISRRRISS